MQVSEVNKEGGKEQHGGRVLNQDNSRRFSGHGHIVFHVGVLNK